MPEQITCHTFSSLGGAWEALLGYCKMDSVFLTPRWQRLWWEHFGVEEGLLLLSFQERSEERRVGKEGRSRGPPYH